MRCRTLGVVVCGVLASCSMARKYDGDTDEWGDSGWLGADAPADEGDDDAWDDDPEADRVLLSPPAALPHAIFVANPERNTLTRIEVADQDIRTVQVGSRPEHVWTSAGLGAAITLNMGSDTVSVVDGLSLAVAEVPVRPNLNTMRLSPDGYHAVVWHDPTQEGSGSSGVQAFNEITVVDLASHSQASMSVGFNPRSVVFTSDGYAVVVADGWLAFVDLDQASDGPELLPLADDPASAPPAREVVVSADGQRLLVRQVGVDEVLRIDRGTGDIEHLPLPAPATDMEAIPGDAAALLIPEEQAVVFRDLWSTPPRSPLTWDDDHGFQAMEASDEGLLLHTSTRSRYGWLDLDSGELSVRSLVKSSTRVALVDGARLALFEHPPTDVEDVDPTSPFSGRHAITLARVDDGWSNPIRLDAALNDVVDSGMGYGYFTVEGVGVLAALDYATLLATSYSLASVPETLGVIPESTRAYASLEHPLGRLTFFDAATGQMQTITGFELNGAIDEQ